MEFCSDMLQNFFCTHLKEEFLLPRRWRDSTFRHYSRLLCIRIERSLIFLFCRYLNVKFIVSFYIEMLLKSLDT